jgi:hypothetical protein
MNYAGKLPEEFPSDFDDYVAQSSAERIRNWEMQHPVDRLKYVNAEEPPPHESYPENVDNAAVFVTSNSYKSRFFPVALDDVAISQEPAYLVDGILPARGLRTKAVADVT